MISLRISPKNYPAWPRGLRIVWNAAIGLAAFGVCTGLCFWLDGLQVNTLNFPIIYVLGVTCVAVFTDGFLYSSVLSLVSVLSLNFFFTDPRFTFNVSDRSYFLAFFLMLAVGLSVSWLTFQLKKRMAEIGALQAEKEILKIDSAKKQEKATLLQSISHDLRTPLTTIKSGAQTLHDNPDLPLEERQEILSEITQKSDWTVKLVENLLSLTRIDGSSLTIKKREEAAEDVIASSVRAMGSEFGKRTLAYDTPKDLLLVPMDATLISQVLVNILTNAIQHTKDDGHIGIKVYSALGFAHFRISNDGVPLREADLPVIFDLYNKRTDRSPESLAGLGLATCQLIVSAHGGAISAANVKGQVVFEFSLPLAEKGK
jgi:two-component system sensor histidine kinase KdpD